MTEAKSSTKVYIALFTCATIRAVHLELVYNMSAESFVYALKRFIARRGVPKLILSDNAKTFKRASKDLRVIQRLLEHEVLQGELTRQRIEWKFIVELSPWWGGFWERMVRSVKVALRSALDRKCLSFDELNTVLIEIESTINQRPLTYISENDQLKPLRPVDFLLISTGENVQNYLPELKIRERSDLLKAWSAQQVMLRRFQKRWQTEYLQQLQSANNQKMVKSDHRLEVGDVLILKDPNSKRINWKLVRVEKVFVGRDGLIRSCEVRTGDGSLLKRPVQLLIPLEFDDDREVLRSRGPEDVEI